jgi:hypothetical protein
MSNNQKNEQLRNIDKDMEHDADIDT